MTKQVSEEEFQKIVNNYTNVTNDKLGSSIASFSDEWFAAASNLLKDSVPIRDATRFTHAGAWYDGWETRRHNVEEYDYVVVKLGVSSSKIIGCEVDTAFFNGNHAPHISVEGSTDPLDGKSEEWVPIIDKMECGPSQRHFFVNETTSKPFTYLRLRMYPDGGIARFRCYGEVEFQKASIKGDSTDMASVLNGGVVVAYNDQHFGKASNLLLPGRGIDMSDGWETKRSRTTNHHDWAEIKLGATTKISKIIVDTAHFRGNFPQSVKLYGKKDGDYELLCEGKTKADFEHEFDVEGVVDYVKLVIIPDGGVKRVRVLGTPQ